MRVTFLGVRGSIPASVSQNLRYGGNTTCVLVETPGGTKIVIDAGSGIRSLEGTFAHGDTIHLLLTHFHWDHVHGLPCFSPLFDPKMRFHFYSGASEEEQRAALSGQMRAPYFPVTFEWSASSKEFACIREPIKIGDATVHTFPLNHPQGAYGYRIAAGGKSIVTAFDREPEHPELDRMLLDHAEGADLLIDDAQYTPEEFERFRGWGHGTWLHSAQVASDAHVKRLVLTHHDPGRSDGEVDRLVELCRERFPESNAAREGIVTEV